VHLQTHSITASKCISKLARIWPSNSHDHGLQVRKIKAYKCISKLAQSRSRSGSLNSLDYVLRVYLQIHSITASKSISKLARSQPLSTSFKERRPVYGNTGVTEADRVKGSIYQADPGVDRHHLISITSYHTTKIHTLSFPTFGLTRSVREVVDPPNCVDPQRQVVSYLLTRFLLSLNQNHSFS
jgi:hypothetical protein